MLKNSRTEISYRDPHGYVVEQNGIFYRVVDHSYASQYDHFINSGLYDLLVQKELLLPFQETANESIANSQSYKVLLPEQLDCLVYPYEWSFSQWKDALEVFLRINIIALKHGMILKDATPFNFTLHRGKLLLFDILSFEMYQEGEPWIAYRQFCENFLAPISLMKYRMPLWSKLYSASANGFPLDFTSKILPWKSYFNASCLLHIHAHAHFKNNPNGKGGDQKSFLSKEQLIELLRSFKKIASWKSLREKQAIWNNYYEADIQSNEYITHKQSVIEDWLKKIKPAIVTDLGANTGMFSVIAAAHAQKVISVESDIESVNSFYQQLGENKNIYPVYADLSNPSASAGFNNKERSDLISRVEADMVLALALIHHLRITYNVPLNLIARFFAELSSAWLVVEFVPKQDQKVVAMLQNRKDIFTDYELEPFKSVFAQYFTLENEIVLHNSERVLFLWRKK